MTDAQPRPLSTRESSRFAMIVCVNILLFLIVFGCKESKQETPSTSSSKSEPSVSVQAARAKFATLHPILDLVGTIVAIPEKTAVISPQLGGWVSKLDVVEGQAVHQGDVLIELDRRAAQIAVQRAEGLVAEKQAVLSRLKSGYLPEEIAGVRQDVDKATATVEGLQNELAALKDLLDRQEISSVLYQTKAKILKSAKATLASAKERVKLFEAGTRPEMIAEAQGLLDAAKADLEQASLAFEWCSITSPIDGVVVQMMARQGQFFDRAVVLATVIDSSEVFAQIRIPSRQFCKIRIGTPVEIQLDSIPGSTFQGSIERIRGEADPLTGNVVVFALIKNSDQQLRPGLSCRAHVSLPELPEVLVIPVAAVADKSGTPVVTVIRDSKAFETKVEIGTQAINLVQILQGLSVDDLVATAGGYGLPQGCPVQLIEDSASKNGKR